MMNYISYLVKKALSSEREVLLDLYYQYNLLTTTINSTIKLVKNARFNLTRLEKDFDMIVQNSEHDYSVSIYYNKDK
jgi:hypothetical protein